MGRPPKYSPEIEKRIVDALRGGCSRRDAYEYGGIDQSTFLRWLKTYATFATLVRDAESTAAVMHTANIAKAAQKGDWKASLEWLKRRRREEWGDSLDLRKLDDDTLIRLLATETGSEPQGADTD